MHLRPPGYEPDELLLLHPAVVRTHCRIAAIRDELLLYHCAETVSTFWRQNHSSGSGLPASNASRRCWHSSRMLSKLPRSMMQSAGSSESFSSACAICSRRNVSSLRANKLTVASTPTLHRAIQSPNRVAPSSAGAVGCTIARDNSCCSAGNHVDVLAINAPMATLGSGCVLRRYASINAHPDQRFMRDSENLRCL